MNSLHIEGNAGWLYVDAGHVVVDGTLELVYTKATTQSTVKVEGNVEHAHVNAGTDSAAAATALSTDTVKFDYDNNAAQAADESVWDEVKHHTGEDASDPQSTKTDWDAATDGVKEAAEGLTKEASKTCEHEWVSTATTDPTCVNPGTETWTCSKCGDTKSNDTDPATGVHTWVYPTENGAELNKICSICGGVSAITDEEAVSQGYCAKIGTIGYTTFENAIKGAKNVSATITLLVDIDFASTDENYKYSNIYDASDSTKNVCFDLTNDTLDLNGHTIHSYGPYNFGSYSMVPVYYSGDNLMIKNGTFTVGKTTSNSYALYLGTGGSSIGPNNAKLENITAVGGINCYGTTATFKNVTSQGTNYYSVWAEHSSKITINSGEYSTSSTSLGGTVFNTDKGAECWIKVYGGNITANGSTNIAANTVSFPATSDAICNKNPGDEYVEKPYGFVEDNGTWKLSKVYLYKVSYSQTGYITFDSWSDVQVAANADSSKVFINMSFYKSANSSCINAYTPINDTTTNVGFGYTASQVYGYGTGFFGDEAEALKCFFKYESSTKTEYFKTEAEANACVSAHECF